MQGSPAAFVLVLWVAAALLQEELNYIPVAILASVVKWRLQQFIACIDLGLLADEEVDQAEVTILAGNV